MIPPDLLHAYLTTTYVVPELDLHIRIGQIHPALDDLLRKHAVTTWAFITASNPASVILSAEENARRHQELLDAIKSYPSWEGMGIGEDSAWEPEQSLLILGISQMDAQHLGRQFAQNAIVLGELHGRATLQIIT